jgi:hypothetical protein
VEYVAWSSLDGIIKMSKQGKHMAELSTHEAAPLEIIKEFIPQSGALEQAAGRLIVRAARYGGRLIVLDELFATMEADVLRCDPPIELQRSDVEVVQYGGDRYAHTFGLEAPIPEGHRIPPDYTRRDIAEPLL